MPIADSLYYARFEGGGSTKKPVVLIHGAGYDHSIWPAELRRLPGRTVLALDLPGHGRSAGIGLQSVEAYSAALISFLAELGLYQAVFIGHSLGGAIALQLALDFAPHVAGLGLISSGACFSLPADLLTRLSSATSYQGGLQWLQKSSFSATACPALIEKSLSILNQTRASVLCNDWKACAQFYRRLQVGQVGAPVYIACGQEDQLTPPAFSRYLAAQMPGSKLEILADAGHMAILEQPQRIAASLSAFFTVLDSTADRMPLSMPLSAVKQASSRL